MRDLPPSLFDLLDASAWTHAGELLNRYPELLGDTTDGLLAEFQHLVEEAGDARTARMIEVKRILVRDARAHGVEAAVQERLIADRIAALTILNRATDPLSWASLQDEVGLLWAHRILGDREDNRDSAIEAFTAALSIYTPEHQRADWTTAKYNLGMVYANRKRADRRANLARAVEEFEASLVESEHGSEDWAETLGSLGCAFLESTAWDRAGSVERAIACFKDALSVQTRDRSPDAWAVLTGKLGAALLLRAKGDTARSVERAITSLEGALEVLTREDSPVEWAEVVATLGVAYLRSRERPPARTWRQAAACFEQAETVFSRADRPGDWARLMTNIGRAYLDRPEGNRRENLEKAIVSLEAALQVVGVDVTAHDRAITQFSLAMALRDRPTADRVATLERALELVDQTLTVRTPDGDAYSRAESLNLLGSLYLARVRGDPTANAERAIVALTEASAIFARLDHRENLAAAQDNLGAAYRLRHHDDRSDNIERAIACHRAALTIRTPITTPNAWATSQHNLGLALMDRVQGTRATNLRDATVAFDAALTVRTRDVSPHEWAATQVSLGAALCRTSGEDHANALSRARDAFSAALEVYDVDSWPHERRQAARSLGDVCFLQREWEEAADAYHLALDTTETLYRNAVLLSSREGELAENAGLVTRAAYACAARAAPSSLLDAVLLLEHWRARTLGELANDDRELLTELARRHPAEYAAFSDAARRTSALDAYERTNLRGRRYFQPIVADDVAARWEQAESAAESEHSEEVRTARLRLEQAVERIRALPGFASFLQSPTREDLKVPEGVIVAYLITTDHGSVSLIVAGGDGSPPVVDAIWQTDFTLAEFQPRFHNFLLAQVDRARSLDRALDELLPSLQRVFVEPLASYARRRGASTLVLVPCGHLGTAPLDATAVPDNDGAEPAPISLEVAYAPSIRLLRRALATLSDSPTDWRLAGVGDPKRVDAQPSPWARAELEEITRHFDCSRPRYGADATIAALRSAVESAEGAAPFVHLSCHGAFMWSDPMASVLALADGALGPSNYTLRQILADQPFRRARLVVASACQTGVGDIGQLPDEALGLGAGLLASGAAGVVATLWSVDARATAILMERFYTFLHEHHGQAWEPFQPARALRRAKNWLRCLTLSELRAYLQDHPAFAAAEGERLDSYTTDAGPGATDDLGSTAIRTRDDSNQGSAAALPFSHPYFWAAFVFLGA